MQEDSLWRICVDGFPIDASWNCYTSIGRAKKGFKQRVFGGNILTQKEVDNKDYSRISFKEYFPGLGQTHLEEAIRGRITDSR